jgi:hypothetical protein
MRLARALPLVSALALQAAAASFCLTAAATTPEETARADTLFKDGLRLFDGGQTAKACAKFAESYQLDPALGTLQNLALCHEKDGKLSQAYGELGDLLTKAQASGKTKRVDVAREHLASLESKVGRVNLSFGEGVQVTSVEIDGVARDWHAPIVLDPGHHTIAARAQGRPDARSECDVTAGGPQTVSVVFTGGSPAVVPSAPAPAPEAPAPVVSHGPPKAVFWALAGVGAAGVVVGSIFGAMTLSQKSAGDSHCSGQYCDATGLSSESSAHTSATVSTVAFAVGLAAVAVDVVLVLTSPKRAGTGAMAPIGPQGATAGRGSAVGAPLVLTF